VTTHPSLLLSRHRIGRVLEATHALEVLGIVCASRVSDELIAVGTDTTAPLRLEQHAVTLAIRTNRGDAATNAKAPCILVWVVLATTAELGAITYIDATGFTPRNDGTRGRECDEETD
jgi:hypothetical protein